MTITARDGQAISVGQAQELMADPKTLVVDVRTPGEFAAGHRIHVPITTNPRVRFTIDGRPCRMEVGQAYEINNQKMHSVMNGGTEDRITFIFDYLPP